MTEKIRLIGRCSACPCYSVDVSDAGGGPGCLRGGPACGLDPSLWWEDFLGGGPGEEDLVHPECPLRKGPVTLRREGK